MDQPKFTAAREPFRPLSDLKGDAHGTARWMSANDATSLDLNSYYPDSLILGENKRGELSCLNRQGHVLVLAPPRSGKGVGFVLPNLLGYQGSMVVTDPKGENAAVSYLHRQQSLGQNVVILDPTGKLASYGLDIPTHNFNPLSVFDSSDYAQIIDDVAMVADALLVPQDGEKEQHWRDGARNILTGLLTFMVFFMEPQDRNLIMLARLANGLEMPLDDIFLALTHNDHEVPEIRDVIARTGGWWDKVNTKERASFVSMVLRSLSWLNTPVWHKHLRQSDFHPYDLKDGKTTVYIVCPFEKLQQYSPWFRLVLSCCILAVLRVPNRSNAPATLFMLDEYAATVGRLAMLEHSIPYIEGCGGRYAMIFQYLSQMQKLWPDPEYHGIFASAGAHVFFNVNDKNTSEYVSNYIGRYGAMLPQQDGMSFVGRELLTPDEVRTLPEQDQIVFIRGYRPAWLGKLDVWTHPQMQNRFLPNPTHAALPARSRALPATTTGAATSRLSAAAAIARAKGRPSLTLGTVTDAIAKKYPDKRFRYEGDLYGYDDVVVDPVTGAREQIFVPVIHGTLIDLMNEA